MSFIRCQNCQGTGMVEKFNVFWGGALLAQASLCHECMEMLSFDVLPTFGVKHVEPAVDYMNLKVIEVRSGNQVRNV